MTSGTATAFLWPHTDTFPWAGQGGGAEGMEGLGPWRHHGATVHARGHLCLEDGPWDGKRSQHVGHCP